MIKGSIQEEDICTHICTYMHPIQEHLYKANINRHKGRNEHNTIIFGDVTPHLNQWTDHPDRKSIRKY